MAGEIMDIAVRMKELREICDFTQEEMAAELGVPAAKYAAYESGAIDIPISVLLAMANACPAVLEAANRITASCDENGVAAVINTIFR